jgi:hypothetical protein
MAKEKLNLLKPYSKPQLLIHGSVEDLTNDKDPGNSDGINLGSED